MLLATSENQIARKGPERNGAQVDADSAGSGGALGIRRS
jgi:hypothetical protein